MRILFSIMMVALVFATVGCGVQKGTFQTKAEPVSVTERGEDGREYFVFNTNDFSEGRAYYYAMNYQGKDIRFFMVKAPDGIVRAAFDACDVCYAQKKGYIYQNNAMTCVACNLRFALDKINYVSGGCNPGPLLRIFDGDRILINRDDVIRGGVYF